MALVIAFTSGPKGGTGKTTTSVTVARILAALGYRVLLVNADDARSAIDWVARGTDEHFPFDVADAVGELDRLADLRRDSDYDFIVVDLPGAREGAFQAMLTGADGQPIADLLVIPSRPRYIELQPIVRAIDHEVVPTGLPYMLVLAIVPTVSLGLARTRLEELRGRTKPGPVIVADTVIRDYIVYDEAHERGLTVLDMPGAHSYARAAETDQRQLTGEILARLGIPAKRRR